ncbi:ABC transporter ATP-binding protein [Kitasatospora sp. NPDC093102]|uniref:ABC transporter ATP-binding protein n=1 Tax=Kitasatospora sp. NPDC093102 TaxID=3155069 RepID=UPI00341B7117
MPGQAPTIRVRGLEKSYEDLAVLRGVDLDVARGGILALLGSDGSGKTTVVKILSTLLEADAGTASVNGFDIATQAAGVRRSIGLNGRFAAADAVLSGRENLVRIAGLRRVEDPGGLADDLLARLSLTGAAPHRVSTYSEGMRRRLDIAMSLIGDPPVVLLDEPTAGLDPEARQAVWRAVRESAGRGAAVLLTTKYLDEAERLADRIAILHEGRIVANGTLTEFRRLLPPLGCVQAEPQQPCPEDLFLAVITEGDEAADGHGFGTAVREHP